VGRNEEYDKLPVLPFQATFSNYHHRMATRQPRKSRVVDSPGFFWVDELYKISIKNVQTCL